MRRAGVSSRITLHVSPSNSDFFQCSSNLQVFPLVFHNLLNLNLWYIFILFRIKSFLPLSNLPPEWPAKPVPRQWQPRQYLPSQHRQPCHLLIQCQLDLPQLLVCHPSLAVMTVTDDDVLLPDVSASTSRSQRQPQPRKRAASTAPINT